MRTLAVIPARGGSKGIPRKNLAVVGGRSLVAWAVAAANESELVTDTVVSTDDDEIAREAERAGASVLRRPSHLADDDTLMAPVVQHAVAELRPEFVVLLQPTSPLRRAEHVDEALGLLASSGADGVVSVVEVPHNFEPGSLMQLAGDRLIPVGNGARMRQAKDTFYARNGPAVLALRADRITDDLYAGDLRAFVMERRDSVDVDSAFDLELAEFLLTSREART